VVAAFPEGAIEVHGVKLLWVKVNREWTGMNVNECCSGNGRRSTNEGAVTVGPYVARHASIPAEDA
jgi:hypothetical protein